MSKKMIWMPLYFEEFMALAATLTPAQLGGLLRLQAYAWHQTPPCTLPNDDARLATISGLGATWREDGPVLRDLLTPHDGRLTDEALLVRHTRQNALHAKRSSAGQEGATRRWNGHSSKALPSLRSGPSSPPERIGSVLPSVLPKPL